MVSKNNKIIKEGYSLHLLSGRNLYFFIDGSTRINLKKIQEIDELVSAITENKKYRNIIDFGNSVGALTEEARSYIVKKSDSSSLKVCDALITRSLTTTIMIGIYIRINRPKIPMRTFSSIGEALKWTETFPI